MFRYIILGLFRDGSVHHGYALAKSYSQRSGAEISTGKVYRELQQLVVGKLIEPTANPIDADPRRTPYRITDRGSRVFDNWLEDAGELGSGFSEDAISARALFLRGATPAVATEILQRWRNQVWLRRRLLERDRDEAREQGRDLLALLLDRRLGHASADLEHIEALERDATTLAPSASLSARIPASLGATIVSNRKASARGDRS